MRVIRLVALAVACLRCASIEQFPRRACLFDDLGRFRTGTVVMQRADGARLFKFDDSTAGDRGTTWVIDEGRFTLRPCQAAGFMSNGADNATPIPLEIPNERP